MKKKLILLLFSLLLFFEAFAQKTILLDYPILTKPIYFKTESALIIMDCEDFLNEFESIVINSGRTPNAGKKIKEELKYHLDSLLEQKDSVFISEKDRFKHIDFNKRTHYISSFNSFWADDVIFQLVKKGKVNITERLSGTIVHKISIKKKKNWHGLIPSCKFWAVKNKKNNQLLFYKTIWCKMRDPY